MQPSRVTIGFEVKRVTHRPDLDVPIETSGLDVPREHASLPTKFLRLKAEMGTWRKAKFPRTPHDKRVLRTIACRGDPKTGRAPCEYYSSTGNLAMGECLAPGCGCTGLKVFVATAKCPHPKGSRWPT
jgi:hypothetical protein